MSSATGYSIIPNWLSKWAGCDSQKKIFAFDLATKKSELGYTAHDGTRVPPQCSYMSISYIAKSCGVTDKVAQRFIREVFEASKGRMSRGKDRGNKKPFFYWISDSVGGSEGEVTGDKSNTVSTNTVKLKRTRTVKAFCRPSLDDVRNYCSENGIDIDCEKFWYHHESKGWVVGKNPMVSWHAAIGTWRKNDRKYNQNGPAKCSEPSPYVEHASIMDPNKIEAARRERLDRKYQDAQRRNGLPIS